jgi:hypothetical protein
MSRSYHAPTSRFDFAKPRPLTLNQVVKPESARLSQSESRLGCRNWEPDRVVMWRGGSRSRQADEGWRRVKRGDCSGLAHLSPRLFRFVHVVLSALEIGDQLRIGLSRRPRRWFLLLCFWGIVHLDHPNNRSIDASTALAVRPVNAHFSLRTSVPASPSSPPS